MIMSSFHKILSLCIDAEIEDDFGWIEEWKRKSKQNKRRDEEAQQKWAIANVVLYVCNMTVLIIPFFLLLILFDRLHTEKIGRRIENEKASKNLVWCEESDSFFCFTEREKRTVWYILHPSISLSPSLFRIIYPLPSEKQVGTKLNLKWQKIPSKWVIIIASELLQNKFPYKNTI